jgi:threonine dehydrogenase-like Zn-dependent dehydrogenase
MRQLTLDAPKTLRWDDVPEPDLEDDGQALVRPLAVATCDLDHPMIAGATPFPLPIALGHECVAEVVEVGRAARSVAVGDRVIVPFQISCGTCDRCRRGLTSDCERVPPLSMYGFGAFGHDHGGFLSDLVRVPFADAMLVRVPEELDPEAVASASDNIADAWRLVAPWLAEWPGAEVLIVGGAGSIGLYAIDIARALGASRVDYVDQGRDRLEVAANLGANVLEETGAGRLGPYPIVADFSGTAEGLRLALRSTGPGGHCTHAAPMFGTEVELPMLELYTIGVNLHTGRAAARPVIPEILRLAAAGRLRPEKVTSAVVAWDDASDELVHPRTKTVVTRG